jgi:LacI family transcriptional regulator
MITIKEMAEILNTSTTTVSNVIHGKSGEVSEAMVEKVKKLIEEYDYVPNINARNLAKNKSGIIGLVMKAHHGKYENYVKDAFAGEFTGAVESCVRAKGYAIMLYISNDIMEIIQSVSSWNADGLIVLGIKKEDGSLLREKVKKPMVFVDCYFDDSPSDQVIVGIEDRKGSYEITKYLIQNGHRKIAYLADNLHGVVYERFWGYRNALEEAGITYDERDFIMLKTNGPDLAPVLSEVFKRAGDFTALVCATDYYAAQILNDFMDRGVSIPQDLSIVGFDDNIYSRLVRPSITTVHQDVSSKSRLAVEKLVQMVQGEDFGESLVQLPVYIVERESVRKR